MAISFIITTYNILPYIERCLTSVAQVARPGDEVIVVDDGSDDGTVEAIEGFSTGAGFPDGVDFRPLHLGANTIGGVGIGGNIGLSEASRDTVFFVDGDDWIDQTGFTRARAYWTLHQSDILITNYLEYDEKNRKTKHPADQHRWAELNRAQPLDALRRQALSFIAVPWRKFYRRDFLEQHKLRFPEGDFFFEDNPLHWAVCLAAGSIGFLDTVICHHRINRPGQTMVSTGSELAAFFTHFHTILDGLPEDDPDLQATAVRWLLGNMNWHMQRLHPSARASYASTAAETLALISDTVWKQHVAPSESHKKIWPIADRLRQGDIWKIVDDWASQDKGKTAGSAEDKALKALEAAFNKRIQALETSLNTRLRALENALGETRRDVRGMANSKRFEALYNLNRD